MKFSPVLVLALVMVGCGPSGKDTETTPEAPQEDVSAKGSLPDVSPGVWTTRDEQGQPFDVVLFQNGQAVSTWVKGPAGAKGQRGFWRVLDGTICVLFDDGWSDRFVMRDGVPFHEGFAPGLSLAEPPTNANPSERFGGESSTFVGVWRLNREPDGSYLYLSLQANGAAYSTINGLTEGRWEFADGAAKVTWPDGWVDQLERSGGTWQKRSWVGGDAGTPADLAQATRVGETKFAVSP
ncbi:MAG: hypothetical protein WEB60_12385 [Terrimicrobiaceae bacterium]